MKNKTIMGIIILLIFTLATVNAADSQIPQNNTPVFIKYDSVWLYASNGDLEKPAKDVKNKTLLYFGNKVNVIGNKKIKDTVYLNVQLPDKTKIWGPLDYFVTKFITITDSNLPCYSQPEDSFVNKVKLQPGYFGYFVKELNGYINVDFIHWAIKNPGESTVWIGNVWIKSGYTEDIKTANQGYYLARVYNELYGKTQNINNAFTLLKKALTLNNGEETSVTYVINDLLSSLNSGTKINNLDTKEGNYYMPAVADLRFRDAPNLDGKFIRSLIKGEKLKLIEKGQEENINGVKGNWGKFETTNGEIGWCFDAYLADYKE